MTETQATYSVPSRNASDGGPAFPHEGMSLRAWLAGQAMCGWAAGRNHPMSGEDLVSQCDASRPEHVAAGCVRYADAIIAELEKT